MTTKNKRILQAVLICIASVIIVWGLLTLLQTIGTNVGLSYVDKISNLIGKYALVIVTMAVGIMTMSYVAGTFNGKVKNIFSISVCAFSTIMTIPLFLSFILMIPVAGGASLPPAINDMVKDICIAFQELVGMKAQYIIYVLGIFMGAIFLAVPIISTYCTVKDIDLLSTIKNKLSKSKNIVEPSADDNK